MANDTYNPAKIFTDETIAFILKHISPKRKRILEVGCGEGDVAVALQNAGANVTAIDTNKKAVNVAIKKGVTAKNIDILTFKAAPFDVILFTRSLHHIHEMRKALEHSYTLLKKGGKLILEEFAVENIDASTAQWYYDTRLLLAMIKLINAPVEVIDQPLQKWEEDHHHTPPLHTGKQMVKEVKRLFKNVTVTRNGYLYRSIAGAMQKNKRGWHLTKNLLEIEERLIKNKLILPNGIRIVAEK